MATPTGLEPVTSSVTGQRSSRTELRSHKERKEALLSTKQQIEGLPTGHYVSYRINRLVLKVGLEPTRRRRQQILSLPRLPIPPFEHIKQGLKDFNTAYTAPFTRLVFVLSIKVTYRRGAVTFQNHKCGYTVSSETTIQPGAILSFNSNTCKRKQLSII